MGKPSIRIGGADEAAGYTKAPSQKTARRAGERDEQRRRHAQAEALLAITAAFERRGIPAKYQCGV